MTFTLKLITALALRAVFYVVVIYGAFVVYQHAAEDHDQPHCPTEDSCTADYRDGEWHIEEVTP